VYTRLPAWLGLVAALTGSVTGPSRVDAQAAALTDINLPYLHYFGFGVFRVGDQEIWALRGRVTPVLRHHEEGRLGIAPRLSGSIAGLRAESITEELRTAALGSAAVGIELRIPLTERSLVRTYADLGMGFDFESDRDAVLGLVGVLGEFVFPWHGWELGLQPGFDLSGASSSVDDLDDRLAALQLKADARHYLGFHIFGNRAQLGGYLDLARFFGDTDLNATTGGTSFVNNQLEVGVTFGTHPRPKILLFRPLLNVGFRWGENLRGIRIGLGDRLTRLPPIP
jgi:hypothetical protein